MAAPCDPLKEYLQSLQPAQPSVGALLRQALRPTNWWGTGMALLFELLLLRMVLTYTVAPVILAIFMLVGVFKSDMDAVTQGLAALSLLVVLLTLVARIRAALPGQPDAAILLGWQLKLLLRWGIAGLVLIGLLLFAGLDTPIAQTLAVLWSGALAGLLLWHCFAMLWPHQALAFLKQCFPRAR